MAKIKRNQTNYTEARFWVHTPNEDFTDKCNRAIYAYITHIVNITGSGYTQAWGEGTKVLYVGNIDSIRDNICNLQTQLSALVRGMALERYGSFAGPYMDLPNKNIEDLGVHLEMAECTSIPDGYYIPNRWWP